jgi:hypothetical protein
MPTQNVLDKHGGEDEVRADVGQRRVEVGLAVLVDEGDGSDDERLARMIEVREALGLASRLGLRRFGVEHARPRLAPNSQVTRTALRGSLQEDARVLCDRRRVRFLGEGRELSDLLRRHHHCCTCSSGGTPLLRACVTAAPVAIKAAE